MLMYSALHIVQWLVLLHFRYVHPENLYTKIFDFNFFMNQNKVAYTRLKVIAKQRSALQVEFIAGVKLICYFYIIASSIELIFETWLLAILPFLYSISMVFTWNFQINKNLNFAKMSDTTLLLSHDEISQ